jgi:hypothetical protein
VTNEWRRLINYIIFLQFNEQNSRVISNRRFYSSNNTTKLERWFEFITLTLKIHDIFSLEVLPQPHSGTPLFISGMDATMLGWSKELFLILSFHSSGLFVLMMSRSTPLLLWALTVDAPPLCSISLLFLENLSFILENISSLSLYFCCKCSMATGG